MWVIEIISKPVLVAAMLLLNCCLITMATATTNAGAGASQAAPAPTLGDTNPAEERWTSTLDHPDPSAEMTDEQPEYDYDEAAAYDEQASLAGALLERIRHLAFRHLDDDPTPSDDHQEVEADGDESDDQFQRQQRAGGIVSGKTKLPSSTNLERPLFLSEDSPEPSCQELRTIWRLTKRAARNSLLTNEIPKHPTSMYGYVVQSPELIGGGAGGDYGLPDGQAFGKIILEPAAKGKHHSGLYGSNDGLRSRTAGSYDRVEEKLRQGIFAEKPFNKLGSKPYYPTKYPKPSATSNNHNSLFYNKAGSGKNKPGPAVYGDMVHHTGAAGRGNRFQDTTPPASPVAGALNRVKAASILHHMGTNRPSNTQHHANAHQQGREGHKNGWGSAGQAADKSSVVYGVYNNRGGLYADDRSTPRSPFSELRKNVGADSAEIDAGGAYSDRYQQKQKPRRQRYGSVYDKPDSHFMMADQGLPVTTGLYDDDDSYADDDDDDLVPSSSGMFASYPDSAASGRLRLYDSFDEQASGDSPLTERPSSSGSLVNRHRDLLRQGFNEDAGGCKSIETKKCRSNADCSCYGLYSCSMGKCKSHSRRHTKGRADDN